MTYLEAYSARLERNAQELKNLIHEVQKLQPKIKAYVSNHGIIQGVVFIDGENINSIHFHEVPYRWSGCGYSEFGKSHIGGENVSMPFTANDVINGFTPVTSKNHTHNTKFKNMEQYLKWCSYLTEYTEQ
jgi:hypothetical protein